MTKKLLCKAEIPDAPKLKSKLKVPHPNWDLYEHGITYSSLSKFIVCRERFRIRYVEGLSPDTNKAAMEFGTIFHKALELHAKGMTTTKIISALRRTASTKKKGTKKPTFDPLLTRIASSMIPYYQDYWKEVLGKLDYFEGEQEFEFMYQCATGKVVPIRGKRDEGFRKDGKIWLQENKTKGQIPEDQIIQTLSHMLQPMMYLLSFKHDHPTEELGGILYNVIRKPQLKKGAKESETAYVKRICSDIEARPDHYFKMFEVEIDDNHLKEWEHRHFDPLVSQLTIWWESIKNNPFDPWLTQRRNVQVLDGLDPNELVGNPHHYVRPFGVYDPMSHGLGDYFVRITQGHDAGLIRNTEIFPELEEYQKKLKSKHNI